MVLFHSCLHSTATANKRQGKHHFSHRGRSAAEIQTIRHQQAQKSGVFSKREMVPRASPDDQFFVVDKGKKGQAEGKLARFADIEAGMEGRWCVGGYGEHFFEKMGVKPPKGWE